MINMIESGRRASVFARRVPGVAVSRLHTSTAEVGVAAPSVTEPTTPISTQEIMEQISTGLDPEAAVAVIAVRGITSKE